MIFKVSYNISEVMIVSCEVDCKAYIIALRESLKSDSSLTHDIIHKLQKRVFSMSDAELSALSDILKDADGKDEELLRFYNIIRVESTLRKKGK